MIKFFIIVRQNLLSKGETGNYLKYAIGEILLVMVGIILALQVNNWNEEWKDKNLKQTFLIKLKSNLQDDILRFNEVSTSNQIYIMRIDTRNIYSK